jgi:hypothetical protein
VFNGGFAANAASTITTADNGVQLNLISTDSGSLNGPRFVMQRTGSAASSGDLLGRMEFYGSDDGGNATEYARIGVNAFDATGGSEDGAYFVSTRIDNVATNRMYMPPSETVFNDESADVDFRVESDTITHALFVEGSSGNVGIGTSSPAAKLDITSASGGYSNIKLVQTGVRTWAIENTGTSGLFKIIEAGVADRLVIDSSGNVGIGTSSPASDTANERILQVNAPTTFSTLSLSTSRESTSGETIGKLSFDVLNNTATYRSRAQILLNLLVLLLINMAQI